jgi:hypothetical protein
MALVKSVLLQSLSGKFGNMVFKQRNGKTYVYPMPVFDKDRIPTQREKSVRAKFTRAVAYAKKVLASAELMAIYKHKVYGKKTMYGVAFRHSWRSPVVMEIDVGEYSGLPGSKIFIRAKDFLKVEELTVSIVSADGVLIEEGNAVEDVNYVFGWVYASGQVNDEMEGCKIIAVAKNLPGNEGVMESGCNRQFARQLQ